MTHWRDRLGTSSLATVFVWAYLVSFLAFGSLFSVLTFSATPHRDEGHKVVLVLGEVAVFSLGFAALSTIAEARRRHADRAAMGDVPMLARQTITAAIRTGQVPPDPALDALVLAAIEVRRQRALKSRRQSAWTFGTVTVASALLAITEEPGLLVLSAVSALAWANSRKAVPRYLARLEALAFEIRKREAR